MGKTRHSLSWEHAFTRTWLGVCRCGWRSIPSTRRESVQRMYRLHVDREGRPGSRKRAEPRAVTPVDQLPALLRP